MCGVLICVCCEMCVHSKRFCVCRQNDRVLCDTGDLTAHTGAFLKVHTGASRAVCLSLSLYFSLSARLSIVGSLFLFSMTMTMSTRPVGCLCARGSDLPSMPECVGLGPFVGWRVARFMQKQLTKYSCASFAPLGMKSACSCAHGKRDALH